ncbi:MAG: toxin-antitoxin system YwqK family antitoxin [Acidimicrobiales bacterium]
MTTQSRQPKGTPIGGQFAGKENPESEVELASTPDFGSLYGGPMITPDGKSVSMWRKGQKVRWYDTEGDQIGPEQKNVAPAVAYALAHGWFDPELAGLRPIRSLEPDWPGFTRQIRMFGDIRVESWIDADGRLQDPPDGSPAMRSFHPDGTVESEQHYQNGRLQDPPDGTPAMRRFHLDGTVESEEHYRSDFLQDPPDGSPAMRWFRSDGTVESEEHWQNGFQIS